MKEQKNLIKTFQNDKESSMIMLDACRFDFFQENYSDYFQGRLTKAYTPTKFTPDWFDLFWNDYYNMTFYNAVEIAMWGDVNYTPEEHFQEVIWCHENVGTNKIQDPWFLNSKIEESLEKDLPRKKLIRYLLPHAPYLGTELEDISKGEGQKRNLEKAFKAGTITEEDLKKAYRKNLRTGLAAARDLCEFLPEPIIITADHGEYLGDNPRDERLLHGRYMPDGPEINAVPWFEVKETKNIHEEEVRNRLEALGYM